MLDQKNDSVTKVVLDESIHRDCYVKKAFLTLIGSARRWKQPIRFNLVSSLPFGYDVQVPLIGA